MSINVCGKQVQLPDFTNRCSSNINDSFLLENWGSPISQFTQGCQLISSEWYSETTSSTENIKYINDPDFNYPINVGDIDTCSGYELYPGYQGNICKRNNFLGNPITCCINDYVCNNNDDSCFSDPEKKQTCDPIFRDILSNTCEVPLIDYCIGDDLDYNDKSWFYRWDSEQSPCGNILTRKLFNLTCTEPAPTSTTVGQCNKEWTLPYSTEGLYWGKVLMNRLFKKYQSYGYIIGSRPGDIGYNSFQEYIKNNICCNYNSLCETALNNVCSSYSPENLVLNQELSSWCGCHLAPQEYQSYSQFYNIPIECSPMCNRPNVIPLTDFNANPKSCDVGTCIIDNVAINLSNTSTSAINIGQICNGCAGGSCYCIISSDDVNIINSTVNGSIVSLEDCNATVCQTKNTSNNGPDIISSSCYNTYTPSNITKDERINRFIPILVIFVGFVILWIAYYLSTR